MFKDNAKSEISKINILRLFRLINEYSSLFAQNNVFCIQTKILGHSPNNYYSKDLHSNFIVCSKITLKNLVIINLLSFFCFSRFSYNFNNMCFWEHTI